MVYISIREKIIKAGQNLKLVKIKAYKINGSYSERICEPYSFRERKTGTIFHFFCRLRNDWRSLRLEHIYEVEILEERFEPRTIVEF